MSDVRQIQDRLLEMFKWFHEYCQEHGLCYYAIGGTMLGAVRHQGFIPWDDDLDVGMPRADYERFIELTKGKMIGTYVVESYRDEKDDFIYPFSKVYDTTTTLVEDARIPVRRGLYIDVFPIDGAGDERESAEKHFHRVSARYRLMLTKVSTINKERKVYKNLFVYLGRMIPDCIISKGKLLQQMDAICQERKYIESKYVGNFLGDWGTREIMEKAIFGTPTEYIFEGISIYGVEKPDEYLTNIYGDYMTPPPVEKQKSHHTYIECNLTKAYDVEE